jgi:hypothetical protein
MVIHTFGDYARYHPHLHAIVADGLFRTNGTFYVLRQSDPKHLEEIFSAKVFSLLRREGKIDDRQIRKLMSWRHSGFSVYRGNRIAPNDRKAQEALAQYIMRNAFAVEKMTFNEVTGQVIYRSSMKHGPNKRNFEVFSAEEFIAAVTQHIPEKSFQMVRYYGWYSNRTRGILQKAGILKPGEEPVHESSFTVIDVSDYEPPRVPSSTWRQLIKKIWEVDPLRCPRCGEELRIISLIQDPEVIRKILEHLGLWRDDPANIAGDVRGSPRPIAYDPVDDGWPGYEEPTLRDH